MGAKAGSALETAGSADGGAATDLRFGAARLFVGLPRSNDGRAPGCCGLALRRRPALPGLVGRELGVRYVLEGSVRKAMNRVRITGQLIDATTGAHLLREWAYARAYQNSGERKAELHSWLHRYNWHRPHAGIDDKTPISRLGLTLRLHI